MRGVLQRSRHLLPVVVPCGCEYLRLAESAQSAESDGVLHITGDSAGNRVEVAQVGDGLYAVKGVFHEGAATRINGGTREFTVKGIESIDISLHGGNDAVVVKGLGDYSKMLAKDLRIETGEGRDDVHVRDMWIVGNGSISTDLAKDKGADDTVGANGRAGVNARTAERGHTDCYAGGKSARHGDDHAAGHSDPAYRR